MKLRFTSSALADLDALKAWLKPRAPSAYHRVLTQLTKRISALRQHPDLGRPTDSAGIRALVEPRYGFVIPYRVVEDTVWVLRSYNARRDPLDYNALNE